MGDGLLAGSHLRSLQTGEEARMAGPKVKNLKAKKKAKRKIQKASRKANR